MRSVETPDEMNDRHVRRGNQTEVPRLFQRAHVDAERGLRRLLQRSTRERDEIDRVYQLERAYVETRLGLCLSLFEANR